MILTVSTDTININIVWRELTDTSGFFSYWLTPGNYFIGRFMTFKQGVMTILVALGMSTKQTLSDLPTTLCGYNVDAAVEQNVGR